MRLRPFLDFPLCASILRLAAPLILSMTGVMLMMLVDGLFLARYSLEAIAAVGPAAMASYVVSSLFMGATGYTSTLAAHYFGADRKERIGSAVWQGVYLSLATGLLCALLAPCAPWIFGLVGHPAAVRSLEVQYFSVMTLGMPATLLAAAASGFFTGCGKTRTVMVVQVIGLALNAGLDYALIFGRLGFPAWGMRGAALATVFSQCVVSAAFLGLFLSSENRAAYGTWRARAFDRGMFARLLRFGLPIGARYSAEVLAWTVFLFYVGRLGTEELAATSIAWRINGLAFFPIIGLAEALRILVGQAQGGRDFSRSRHATWQGIMMAEVYMVGVAVLFLVFPGPLYLMFQGQAAQAPGVVDLGRVLLRFVTAYCLLDAVNIVVGGMLMAAGDTRWTLWASLLLHGSFIGALAAADGLGLGLLSLWGIATVFVLGIALVWLARFLSAAWERIEVIEAPDDLVAQKSPAAG
jgi:MATE family multidrug resistance protein